ncbi:MAG: CHAT domain-containing protein [Alphaproteobacteria bacterium]|nr:CHAT domain-containing protein [Alphaproteobacteria bacterium]
MVKATGQHVPGSQPYRKNYRSRDYPMSTHGTHVVVPGELQDWIDEPALVLPIPRQKQSSDDGILTESEVARLKLASSRVLLSACSISAPPGASSAEALSGLARAFLLAGASTIGAMHWGGNREAARTLMVLGMFDYSRNREAGLASAFRSAMQNLMMESDDIRFSHPAFWAPMTIVGDGFR